MCKQWTPYEVDLGSHIYRGLTLQSLAELKKEHKEIGYKLISYNNKPISIKGLFRKLFNK